MLNPKLIFCFERCDWFCGGASHRVVRQ